MPIGHRFLIIGETMSSVFSKTRLLVLSVAHRALDAGIDMNSVEAVKQNIRDLETSRDQLSGSVATSRGHVTGVQREVSQLTARMEQLNHQADSLLNDNDPTNDHHVDTLEAELATAEEMLAVKQEELTSAQDTVRALDSTLSKLTAKLTAMKGQLGRLEAMDRSARAKENAAEAMRQATRASASGTGVSVDSVAARVQRRDDVADEKLKSAMSDFASTADQDTALATVAARVAERRKRLASASAGTPTTPAN